MGRRMSLMDHFLAMPYPSKPNDWTYLDWELHVQWKLLLDEEREARAKLKAALHAAKTENKKRI